MSSTRVLLIEDDDRARADLADTLIDEGFDAASLANAEDAIVLLGAGQVPDILITEVNPKSGLCGQTLAELARSRRPEVEVVYLAADDQPDAARHFGERDWLVARPFSLDQFLAVIRRARHIEPGG
jgi:DNA-binding NtrC family response regulator